jgi:hypothetical protein
MEGVDPPHPSQNHAEPRGQRRRADPQACESGSGLDTTRLAQESARAQARHAQYDPSQKRIGRTRPHLVGMAVALLFEFLTFIESRLGQSDHGAFVAQPLPFDGVGQAGGKIFC